jgi:hypothetical protein
MFANKKMAFGAKNTMIWTVTPADGVALWGALGCTRPGSNVPGNMVWGYSTGEGDPVNMRPS